MSFGAGNGVCRVFCMVEKASPASNRWGKGVQDEKVTSAVSKEFSAIAIFFYPPPYIYNANVSWIVVNCSRGSVWWSTRERMRGCMSSPTTHHHPSSISSRPPSTHARTHATKSTSASAHHHHHQHLIYSDSLASHRPAHATATRDPAPAHLSPTPLAPCWRSATIHPSPAPPRRHDYPLDGLAALSLAS
ncbi:hypothetical protein BKA81DRAFT_421854 [Phyllosticta paracitricarpa]